MIRILALTATAGLLSAALPLHAGASSTRHAYYTRTQATAGAKAYAQNCSQCHGVKLEGVDAPALAGPAMHGSQRIGDLYSFLSVQMPAGKPGSLSPSTYAAIMAFLIQKNGHPAGAVALTPAKAKAIKEKI